MKQQGRRLGLGMALVLGVAIAVAGLFYGGRFDGNITGFFRIGSVLPLSPLLEPQQTLIFPGELGYDGQQFLSIALDPGLREPGTIAALDHPSYRYRRILYPVLGYVLGGGQPALIPWALVGINLGAIAVCGGLVMALRSSILGELSEASYLWERWGVDALMVLTVPGVWMILSLSTADLLASVWGLGAIWYSQQKRWWGMGLCLAAGLLTRETLLIIWLALLLTQWPNKDKRSIAALGGSLMPLMGWLGYIRWLGLPGSSGTGNFGWPLLGILHKFQALLSGGLNSSNLYEGFVWGLLLANFAYLVWRLAPITARETPSLRPFQWATGLYMGLGLVAGDYILNYYLNYNRVFLDVFLLALIVPASQIWPKRILLTGVAIASVAFIFLQS